jgi:hypothetical protein
MWTDLDKQDRLDNVDRLGQTRDNWIDHTVMMQLRRVVLLDNDVDILFG